MSKFGRETWEFPHVEGIYTRPETGEWNQEAFFNDLVPEDDQFPEVWYQAKPKDTVEDAQAWQRWLDFLTKRPRDAEKALRMLAIMAAKRKIRSIASGKSA